MTLRRNKSTPEGRAFWADAEEAAKVVAERPERSAVGIGFEQSGTGAAAELCAANEHIERLREMYDRHVNDHAEEVRRLHEAAADVVELWMKLKDPDDIVFERRICDLEELIPSSVLAKRRIMRPDEATQVSGVGEEP